METLSLENIVGIPIEWNEEKNEWLKKERQVSFESLKDCIVKGNVIELMNHKNQNKYPNQKIFILKINNYIYCVPFVYDGCKIFLKTAYKSRKCNKIYNLNV